LKPAGTVQHIELWAARQSAGTPRRCLSRCGQGSSLLFRIRA
jgi:hypothetical protein